MFFDRVHADKERITDLLVSKPGIDELHNLNFPFGQGKLPDQPTPRVKGRLHLDKLGAKLTEMSEEQAAYIGVKKEGPYKPEHYRY